MDRNIIKRKRRRRKLIAFVLRTFAVVFFVSMAFLVVCGGIYLYSRVSGKGDSLQAAGIFFNQKEEPDTEYAGYVIILDAGHGGSDQGTSYENILEKDINLAVTLKVKELLELHGAEVILTRSGDEHVGLNERTALANESDTDLFVSIHCNFYEKDSAISGLECYYYTNAASGKKYAEDIFGKISDLGNIGVRDAKPENYYVLRNTEAPAVLIEIGYLSNETDRRNLVSESYQNTLAADLAEGILESLKE
jgi:N-acetylmuramoyl-L-alanine amidase